jgi:PilZ domain-containing protein
MGWTRSLLFARSRRPWGVKRKMAAARDPLDPLGVFPLRRTEENRLEPAKRLETVYPRRIFLVPTHAVGLAFERRVSPRAALRLPLRLIAVDGQAERFPITLVTKNISSTGVFFLAPCEIQAGAAIEMEVGLLGRPLGQGSVHMRTAAHIVRIENADTPGWRGYAATFDDIAFRRDDSVPPRFDTV